MGVGGASIVEAAVAQVEAGFADLAAAGMPVLSDAESRDLVARAHAMVAVAQSVYLRALRDLDGRPDAVAGARPGAVGVTFARHRLRRSNAAADVRAAYAVADHGELPRLGAALAAGEVSREHVD